MPKLAIAGLAILAFTACKPSMDSQLTQLATELNKTCPMMVDKDTRLDNAMAVPGNIFQYNYTLVNYVKDSIDTARVRPLVQQSILSNVKTNPDLKSFRDNKTTLTYSYKDKAGVFLFKVSATPADYGAN